MAELVTASGHFMEEITRNYYHSIEHYLFRMVTILVALHKRAEIQAENDFR